MNDTHRISAHARQRMSQMNVTEAEVLSAIAYPIETRPAHRSTRPATYSVARRITAVVGEDGCVITVLWTEREASAYLQPERWPRGTNP